MRGLLSRSLVLVFAVVLSLSLVPAAVADPGSDTTLVGTNVATVDVLAVQDAVNTYDVVRLQGTFDFGTESVNITRSVQILGEGVDALDNYGTRILGGGLGALRSTLDNTAQIVVRDIEFAGSETALYATHSEWFEVTGCRISIDQGAWWGGFGIDLSTETVTGRVVIEGNHFDISSPGPWSVGFWAQQVLADIDVHDNLVENFHYNGIFANSSGEIDISENTVIAGPTFAGPPEYGPFYRNGIIAGSWWVEPGDRGNLEVADNTITMGGHTDGQGIVLEDSYQEERDVCSVADNEIEYVQDSPNGHGILLLGYVSNCEFDKNTIDGGGHEQGSGIALAPATDPFSEGGIQEGNTFTKNEVRNATHAMAGVFIDSKDDDDGFLVRGNQFNKNKLTDIGGTGFVVDGGYNQFNKNKLKVVADDGFLLLGDNNLLEKNKLKDIGGQHVVDLGVNNHVMR